MQGNRIKIRFREIAEYYKSMFRFFISLILGQCRECFSLQRHKGIKSIIKGGRYTLNDSFLRFPFMLSMSFMVEIL